MIGDSLGINPMTGGKLGDKQSERIVKMVSKHWVTYLTIYLHICISFRHSLIYTFISTFQLHYSCTSDPRTKTCCPSFYTCSHTKCHSSAYTHLYTKCSTCATMKVRPCPHSTKTPDYRDVTEEVTNLALQMMYLTQNAHGPH